MTAVLPKQTTPPEVLSPELAGLAAHEAEFATDSAEVAQAPQVAQEAVEEVTAVDDLITSDLLTGIAEAPPKLMQKAEEVAGFRRDVEAAGFDLRRRVGAETLAVADYMEFQGVCWDELGSILNATDEVGRQLLGFHNAIQGLEAPVTELDVKLARLTKAVNDLRDRTFGKIDLFDEKTATAAEQDKRDEQYLAEHPADIEFAMLNVQPQANPRIAQQEADAIASVMAQDAILVLRTEREIEAVTKKVWKYADTFNSVSESVDAAKDQYAALEERLKTVSKQLEKRTLQTFVDARYQTGMETLPDARTAMRIWQLINRLQRGEDGSAKHAVNLQKDVPANETPPAEEH